MFDNTNLYDQNTFYESFSHELLLSKNEVIIESPFITIKRMDVLLPLFQELRRRGVKVIINTKIPSEHTGAYYDQAIDAVERMQEIGITVLYTSGHHRKLAIIDRRIIYEGSLNILSFNDSCEIMRKIVSVVMAEQLVDFIGIKKYLR